MKRNQPLFEGRSNVLTASVPNDATQRSLLKGVWKNERRAFATASSSTTTTTSSSAVKVIDFL